MIFYLLLCFNGMPSNQKRALVRYRSCWCSVLVEILLELMSLAA